MSLPADRQFSAIADHLRQRREVLLANWQLAVDRDPRVTAAAALARAQFVDHIPRILDAFEWALRARDRRDESAAEAQERAGAADHGEHRWLHGYNSRETMREWGHLQICMLSELEEFALAHPEMSAIVLSATRAMLAQLFVDCMIESAASHATLERAEAQGRLEELERVLAQLKTLDRARIELWREAAHDLRGSVGAVKLAATALGSAVATPQLPAFVNLVRRGADSLDSLLNDLIELTRLEAGRERLEIASFDAGRLIGELCDSFQPLAAQRKLFLQVDAPTLLVAGDKVKVRRIAQNLILNALKYTQTGGVQVSSAEANSGETMRWALCVQDTGVGLAAQATPLAHAISAATQEAHSIARQNAPEGAHSAEMPPAPTLPAQSGAASHPGEGIGLSIVKRLCELLDATIELQTSPGRGTTFRIIFPSRYSE